MFQKMTTELVPSFKSAYKFTKWILLLISLAFTAACQRVQEERTGLPEYEVVDGECPETGSQVVGSCTLKFKQQAFAKTAKRYLEFGANLSNTGSRVTLVLNATNERLSDGVHLTFVRDNSKVTAYMRLDGGQFDITPARTSSWTPTNLRLGLDFHPRGNNPPGVFIWKTDVGTKTEANADVSTTATPNHFSPTLYGSSGTGEISGIILYEAAFFNDDYKQSPETKVTLPASL